MAFQQSAAPRQIIHHPQPSQESSSQIQIRPAIEDSQEWVLFSPSNTTSTITRTHTSQTVGLSRASDLGSLNTAARSGRLDSSVLDEDATEDGDLDSLDDGLHAFREPSLYPTLTNQTPGAVLPAHDGLGTFQASSPPVLEQLWQHEQFNSKRKHDGHHRRPSSVQRRLDTIEEIEAQANEEKRMRIEKWRMEQSQALMEEVERETRRHFRRGSRQSTLQDGTTLDDLLGSTPKQSDYLAKPAEEADGNEPFWRRITKRFIRDVIGIDEPLLSVIFGESLPEEAEIRPSSSSSALPTIPEQPIEDSDPSMSDTWRDKLIQRIARELGVYVHQLTPHPGPFTTYSRSPDYAGMPVNMPPPKPRTSMTAPASLPSPNQVISSVLTPNFPPTVRDPAHAESWGFEEEPSSTASPLGSSRSLQKEREYWERELDLKMVFRYLRDRFASAPAPATQSQPARQVTQDAATRTAIIRQHHPLVARAHRSPARLRRDSRVSVRRPASSCASESARSSRRNSLARSGSSRNYWDLGGSVGSGSLMASGGLMGAWGEV